eukprot:g8475.t1
MIGTHTSLFGIYITSSSLTGPVIPIRSSYSRPTTSLRPVRQCKSPLLIKEVAQCHSVWRPLSTPVACTSKSDSNSPRSQDNQQSDDNKPSSVANWHDTLIFVMRLPFLYASTLAATNDHWLRQRNRSKWWSQGYFPRLPKFTVRDAMRNEKVNHPFRLVQKMTPLAMIFFCATFNLCILQTMKDSLIVSTIGAESLPFLASFGVLPASFLFFGFYHYLLNQMPQKLVFYVTLIPLLSVYAVFVVFLYPASDWLHPHGVFDAIISTLPIGFHGLVRCLENWTFSIFFCVAELWGGIVISVLFWSLANDICTVTEATTIYPLLGLSANIALVFAGKLIKFINLSVASGSALLSYRILISIVLVNSLIMMYAKFYMDRTLSIPTPEESIKKRKPTKSRNQSSFKDGLKVIRKSPKIWNLAMLVIGYSVSHRFFDVVWKGQLKLVYPTTQQYQSVLADVSVWTGISTIIMLLTGKFIFQYLGWGVAAGALPVVMLTAGSIFYLSFFAMDHGSLTSSNVARIGVIAGNATQVATRAAKFSLFDPAKEMVYIEMNKEEKGKGKAAVDLIGSQVGKTGASWVSQGLLLSFGSISASMPVFGVLYLTVIIIWLFSVKKLQRLLALTEAKRKKKKKMKLSMKNDKNTYQSVEKNEVKKSEMSPHAMEEVANQNGDRPPWVGEDSVTRVTTDKSASKEYKLTD